MCTLYFNLKAHLLPVLLEHVNNIYALVNPPRSRRDYNHTSMKPITPAPKMHSRAVVSCLTPPSAECATPALQHSSTAQPSSAAAPSQQHNTHHHQRGWRWRWECQGQDQDTAALHGVDGDGRRVPCIYSPGTTSTGYSRPALRSGTERVSSR